MSLSGAVAAQFKLILLEKCSGHVANKKYCLEAGWPQLDARCLFHLFTALLGFFLILIISCGQLPLLINILRNPNYHSVKPLPLALVVLSSSNYVTYAVYRNLPLSTWGEGIPLLIQHVITANLLFLYNGRHRNAVLFMLLYTASMVVLLWPLVPGCVIVALKVANMPIVAFVKTRLLYKAHLNQGMTHLPTRSSLLLLNLGSYGRLLTSLVDTRDLLMVVSYLEECVFNTVFTIQTVRYRKRMMKALPQDCTESAVLKQRGAG